MLSRAASSSAPERAQHGVKIFDLCSKRTVRCDALRRQLQRRQRPGIKRPCPRRRASVGGFLGRRFKNSLGDDHSSGKWMRFPCKLSYQQPFGAPHSHFQLIKDLKKKTGRVDVWVSWSSIRSVPLPDTLGLPSLAIQYETRIANRDSGRPPSHRRAVPAVELLGRASSCEPRR